MSVYISIAHHAVTRLGQNFVVMRLCHSLCLFSVLALLNDCLIMCADKGAAEEEEWEDEDGDGEKDNQAISGLAEFRESCGAAVNLGVKKTVYVQSPDFDSRFYGDEMTCKYYIYGTATCIPNLHCDIIDLRKSQDCEKEHFRISDGVGGEAIFCGRDSQPDEVLQASRGFRDLFLTFKSGKTEELGSSNGYKGVACTATCGRPGKITEKALELQGKPRKVLSCACGIQNKNDRIINGEDVEMNEFPWQVALVVTGTRKPFCGGALINDRFILTAAHCFYFTNVQPEDFQALLHARVLDFKLNAIGLSVGGAKAKNLTLGEFGSVQGAGWKLAKQTDESEKSIRLNVTRVINHPLFASNFDFDCAILEFEPPLKLKDAEVPTPVCLPPLGIMSNKYTGENATVVGWGKGHESAGSNNRLLQKLTVPVLNLIECNMTFPYPLTRRMICAGFMEGGKDACTGDSGGPLMYKSRDVFRQIGIVSFGEGCARVGRPGLYSRVTEFNQWISYETSEADAKWCRGI